jgi:hypothetical protein
VPFRDGKDLTYKSAQLGPRILSYSFPIILSLRGKTTIRRSVGNICATMTVGNGTQGVLRKYCLKIVPRQNPNNKAPIVEENGETARSLVERIDHFDIPVEVAHDDDEAICYMKALAKFNLAPYYLSQCVPIHR